MSHETIKTRIPEGSNPSCLAGRSLIWILLICIVALFAGAQESVTSPRMAALEIELNKGNRAALEAFWKEIETESAPLIEPIKDDQKQMLVTFLWRAAENLENVVVVAPVLGSDRSKNRLQRLPNTDLWSKTYKLPKELRTIYHFALNAPLPSLGPLSNRRRDPLNPKTFVYSKDPDDPASQEYAVSLLELPKASPQPWIVRRPDAPEGRVVLHRLKSQMLNNERRVYVYTPPQYQPDGTPFGLLIVFDGFAYTHYVPTPTVLDNLIADKAIPPVVAVLIDNPNQETRGRELECYAPFSDFLIKEALPWIRKTYHVTSDAAQTVVAGSSSGGSAAVCAALRHPEVFGNVLAQSGSYFENPDNPTGDEWAYRFLVTNPRLPLRFYLDVGRFEPPFSVNASRQLRNILEAKGYPVYYAEFCGGHDYSWWRETIADGLIALLGKTGHAPAAVGAAQNSASEKKEFENCTVIGVGKLATADGSVITSQSDCCSECRVHIVPGRTYKKGEMAPVYWGMVYFGPKDDRGGRPLGDYGKVIGQIPQAEKTYTYFHTGYSHLNEHQLAIGESTCSQKQELDVTWVEGVTSQIMTIEQAQIFALQRCRTAREAVKLIGSLVETYGFLPSCGGSEALCIADPTEAWVQEIFSVGADWDRASGKPGAIWAARRIPDGHLTVIPNFVRIREIDLNDPDFLASPNYRQVAIDHGWYDPESGKPFIWQEAYAPPVTEGSLNRLWLIYSTVAPSAKQWPQRKLFGQAGPDTMSSQPVEGPDFYPFSVKPERKISVRDIIAFQRSTFEGTIYDTTADPGWLVTRPDGKAAKSPLASPFASHDLKKLLRIVSHRPVAREGYGMVAQLRSWLPDTVGGVYWFYLDNPYVSTYVPIYAGVEDVSQSYKTYDIRSFSDDSARWAVDFVEKLLFLRWQDAVKALQSVRDPLENEFLQRQKDVEEKVTELLSKNPVAARKYLTDLTVERMNRVVKMYKDLRNRLITEYSEDPY